MIFSKASRLPVLAAVLCLLLMGFAGASYGAVRFDVVPSPTEVINTGLSEVTGSFNLIVRGTGNVTGTSTGGAAQIGIIYNSQGTFMPIDNTTVTGIKIFYSSGFATAAPSIVAVFNQPVGGKCSGQITINLLPNATPAEGAFIRVEGVRGRIAGSSGVTQGTDMYASLQSINDPTANSFNPDFVRVSKSLPGLLVQVNKANLLLCFPTTGVPPSGTAIPSYSIKITEGFARAFVDLDAGNDGSLANDRVDSGQSGAGIPTIAPALLGAPTNSTQFYVLMDSIPASVASITWPDSTPAVGTGAILKFISSTSDGAGNAIGRYSYETPDQVNVSDITVETFTLQPIIVLKANSTATGIVNVAVTLAPNGGSSACEPPGNNAATDVRPRFALVPVSDADPSNEVPGAGDPSLPYAQIIRCNCYLLFTYVTYGGGFNTGFSVANTSQDSQVFGTGGAAQQVGKITFYFYSAAQGYRGFFTTGDVSFGQSYVALLSQMLATANMPDTTFSGYIIAKAEFQYCHAVSYIADNAFAATAQGYPANIIPDPSIKGGAAGKRTASDAGDVTNLPAGEGLNN